MLILKLLACTAAYSVLCLLVNLLVARGFRLQVTEATLFSVPFVDGPQRWRLGLFPLGSSLQVFDSRYPETLSFPLAPGRRDAARLPLLARIVCYVADSLVVLAVCAVLLGSPEAFESWIRGFSQLTASWFTASAPQLVASLRDLLQAGPPLVAFGLVATKLLALDWLPLPGGKGGFLYFLGARGNPSPARRQIIMLGLGLRWVLVLTWTVTIGRALAAF